MIKTVYYKTRDDGVNLNRTYSDNDVMINKDVTDELYAEAIDVEDSGYTYTETDIPIEVVADELTLEDTLAMLSELGVDIDDQ